MSETKVEYTTYSDTQILDWFINNSGFESSDGDEIRAFAEEEKISFNEAVRIIISEVIASETN